MMQGQPSCITTQSISDNKVRILCGESVHAATMAEILVPLCIDPASPWDRPDDICAMAARRDGGAPAMALPVVPHPHLGGTDGGDEPGMGTEFHGEGSDGGDVDGDEKEPQVTVTWNTPATPWPAENTQSINFKAVLESRLPNLMLFENDSSKIETKEETKLEVKVEAFADAASCGVATQAYDILESEESDQEQACQWEGYFGEGEGAPEEEDSVTMKDEEFDRAPAFDNAHVVQNGFALALQSDTDSCD